eukprot:m.192855 g.192855  ORF g.192855 m.192855 type:complete len:294 (-) comp16774_c1_seq2:1476-2357(-)
MDARAILRAQGWKEGEGLGRTYKGMAKALKPKLKFDKFGVGGDDKEKFTFAWWDHAFNRAAENIQIDSAADGEVAVKSKEDLGELSTSEPRKVLKDRFYGMFVKATHKDDEPEIQVSKLDKDFSFNMSDEELFQACGGLTGHKAARHGLSLNGKLQRVQEFEAKLKAGISPSLAAASQIEEQSDSIASEQSDEQKTKAKSKKTKKSKHKNKTEQAAEPEIVDKKNKKKKIRNRGYRTSERHDLVYHTQAHVMHVRTESNLPNELGCKSVIYEFGFYQGFKHAAAMTSSSTKKP